MYANKREIWRGFLRRLQQLVQPKVDHMKDFKDGKGRRFEFGGGWGDAIWFVDNAKMNRAYGWKSKRPDDGDFLLVKMESGQTGIFRFQNVDWKTDPADMFVADTLPVGYLEG